MRILDCRGLSCPKPVVLTKKELEAMENGKIQVIVDNLTAKDNISKFVNNLGFHFEILEKEGCYNIIINKENVELIDKETVECTKNGLVHNKNVVLVVGTERLGLGDDKLGEVLMKSYMFALSECEDKPKTILFLNGGVKLTSQGSEVLESLKMLENSGTEIMSCGTCLDFFGLKEKLIIGSITNMYSIINKMNEATNTIKL
jgi:selenium metabolism protein YedF